MKKRHRIPIPSLVNQGMLSLLLLTGCAPSLPVIGNHQSLSSLTRQGFALKPDEVKALDHKMVSLWGYLDSHNIALAPGTIARQPSHWDVPRGGMAGRIVLKARYADGAGEGVGVRLRGEAQQYRNLFNQIRDLEENPQVPVLVTGMLKTFAAPANFSRLTGVVLEVSSAEQVQLARSGEKSGLGSLL